MLAMVRSVASVYTAPYSNDRMHAEQVLNIERTKPLAIVPQKTLDGIVLVDWYTTDDPANPQNWSSSKKYLVVFVLCFYTWTVYCAGPIYSTATNGIVQQFGVGPVATSLGLSLYILAYGVGDLLFSPLTEIPVTGRNPIYYLTFIIFWALSFPPAVVNSFGGLLALRFWMGFFGCPALANGGATIGDMFPLIYIPYGLSWWVFSAWGGPAFGPLIGGFAAMAKGWRWPMWEVVWMASPVLVVLLCLMPETSASNILLKKARRLRKLTGDSRLLFQSEIDQRNLSATSILFSALIRPMEIMLKDPSIFFVNVYTGYFYGVFYTFFEVFPLVFPPFYGFNLGQTGLAFLACFVGVVIALLAYLVYLRCYMVPAKKSALREAAVKES
jgi:DHA1 family multidrug resistance protein-like MFS transporter